jgi:hypothetical protein
LAALCFGRRLVKCHVSILTVPGGSDALRVSARVGG